jgi:glucokinase
MDKTVMTLDAGGTNFVFSAIRDGVEMVSTIQLPALGHDLDLCLGNIIKGFRGVERQLPEPPAAISFAFPGPADYPNGIIGDLGNLPAFRGGVALGPMLEEHFGIPVFINNDGDLFAYGEAIEGFQKEVNKTFFENGLTTRSHNLLGVTLGTGFGGGIVSHNRLYTGNNSAGAEIWVTSNAFQPGTFAEESISIRAIQRAYARLTRCENDIKLTPKEIYDIGCGNAPGDINAAKKSFRMMGKTLGDVLANAITLLDCNVVIGGGLSNAYPLFADSMMEQLNGKIQTIAGDSIDRLEVKAFNLEDLHQRNTFFNKESIKIKVPYSHKEVEYNPQKRVAIGLSKLGTSKAVALGAYAFAMQHLNGDV